MSCSAELLILLLWLPGHIYLRLPVSFLRGVPLCGALLLPPSFPGVDLNMEGKVLLGWVRAWASSLGKWPSSGNGTVP